MENWLGNVFVQILNMSITAGYCIIAVLLIRLVFRKAPRKYLYALWLVVAFRLVCPVSVSSDLSLFNTGLFSISAPDVTLGAMEYIPADEYGVRFDEMNTGSAAVNMLVNQQIPHALYQTTGFSCKTLIYAAFPYMTAVWTVGVIAFGVYYTVSARRLRRIVRWAVRTKEWEHTGFGKAEIYECDELTSPFAMGIFRPRIYLPCHLEGEERQMILLHEQYHIRRKDHVVKLFAYGVLSVYWFHPLVWAAWFGMCKDMEMSCDEKVLEYLGEGYGKAYSITLLTFASEMHTENRMPLGFGEHDVKSRVRHALEFQKTARWISILAVLVIGIVLAVFGTNGKKNSSLAAESESGPQIYSDEVMTLYDSYNPYVGDISADGKVIQAIRGVLPGFAQITAFQIELQTSEEPYQFHFVLEKKGVEEVKLTAEQEEQLYGTMVPAATLMMALIDNLGEVKWSWLEEEEYSASEVSVIWDVESAEMRYGIQNLKSYGTSLEKVQELVDILRDNPVHGRVTADGSDALVWTTEGE